MCLVIFAHRCHPEYPLVVAANRDEFHARATRAAQFWPQQPDLLAGQDLVAGGTWMGLTRCGKFAAITNYRDPARSDPAPRSRGELTVDFLIGQQTPESYLNALSDRAHEYGGFNLLLGDGSDLWYFSNSNLQQHTRPRQLQPGIYGLSNALLDTPWPKVALGKERLDRALQEDPPDHDSLLQVVSDRTLADPQQLHPLGLKEEMDTVLSAQFITAGDYGYGTRSSTTLWLTAAGASHWRELSFNDRGELAGTSETTFNRSTPG